MNSVLITGGAGFIGCALSQRLVDTGYRVTVIDNLHPQVHSARGRPRLLSDAVELVPADVTTPSNWDALLKLTSPDLIVHLVAETGTGQSLAEASRHGRVNIVGTTEMLDALLRTDTVPARIILASSRAVYGEGTWITPRGDAFSPGIRTHDDLVAGRWDPRGPTGEPAVAQPSCATTTVTRPTSVYGATKLAQEHILTAWTAATGTDLSILRLQNVYGPGQSVANSYTGVVTLFAQIALSRRRIEVYEDGQIVRDFVYIDDVVDAIVASIDASNKAPETFDIGSGSPTTIYSLAADLSARLDGPTPVISGRFRDGDVRSASTDITPARAQLGYQPRWGLREGLDALLAWIMTEVPANGASAAVATVPGAGAKPRRAESGESTLDSVAVPTRGSRHGGTHL